MPYATRRIRVNDTTMTNEARASEGVGGVERASCNFAIISVVRVVFLGEWETNLCRLNPKGIAGKRPP